MNYPRANRLSTGTRLRLFFVVAAMAAMAAMLPAGASADITPTASTIYEASTPGAHGDYTIRQDFDYGNGAEPQPGTEDMKKWIIDSPAGLYGNPNAVPYEDRCDPASFDPTPAPAAALSTFFTGSCPASSRVGDAQVYLVNDAQSGSCPNANPIICLTAGFDMQLLAGPLQGVIYILKTDPEVPTTLGTQFVSSSYQNFDFSGFGGGVCATAPATPCAIQPKTKSIIAPVTSGPDGDFRLRTIPAEYSTPPTALLPTAYGHAALPGTPLHVRRIDQQLYGLTNAGKPFLTYPTRCGEWKSIAYAHAWGSNGTATRTDMDPAHPSDAYSESNTDTFTPSCDYLPAFRASVTAAINTADRSVNPQLDVVLNNPGGTTGDVPKDVMVKLPGSIAADIDGIQPSKLCTIAERDANACPPASKVGTVTVETPLISAGLTGDVHLIAKTEGGLPNLAFFVTGAISFRLDATTAYVGAKGTEIETTLSNLPQVPFTKFSLRVNGGASDSLLVYRECPTDGSGPQDGPITNRLTGYTGAVVEGSNTVDSNGCYGTPKIKSPKKCVKYKLAVTPTNMIHSENIAKAELYVGSSKRSQRTRLTKDTAAPWKLQKRLGSKFKDGKKYYMYVKVTYKPTLDVPAGKVLKSKVASFKRCK